MLNGVSGVDVSGNGVSGVHPVVEVLRARRDQGSLPGERSDGCRVALAVEGGGMRGIISASMMVALKDEGLENAFDEIYGVSAGAINCAYFLSGYGWYGLSSYYDDLICKEFFDWGRALRGQPMLSLDYVTDVVMETLKPLDVDAILASPIQLHIAASSVGTARPRDFSGFQSGQQLKTIIKASACLPIVGGPPVEFDGDRFLDGSVLLSHPLVEARSAGCSHIVSLNTRTSAALRKIPTVSQQLVGRRLDLLRPGLGERYIENLKSYRALRRETKELSDHRSGPPFVLDVACLDGAHRVSRLTRDRGMLFEGIRAGYNTMMNALEEKPRKAFLRPVLLGE
jgi:predicted patatin/cPLA2 family phospholipase